MIWIFFIKIHCNSLAMYNAPLRACLHAGRVPGYPGKTEGLNIERLDMQLNLGYLLSDR